MPSGDCSPTRPNHTGVADDAVGDHDVGDDAVRDHDVGDHDQSGDDSTPGGPDMTAWLVWLAIAAVLGIAEMMTLSFAAGLMALAAAAAAVVAGVGGGAETQALVFAAASFASLVAVLPLARRRIAAHGGYRSGVDALAGRPAVVLTQVDAVSGTVRIGGEIWSARTYDETQIIPEGTRVAIFEIDGATALVYTMEFT